MSWIRLLRVPKKRLTLRMRLAAFSAALLLVLSLGLVLFINVTATITASDSETVALTVPLPGPPADAWQEGMPTPTPMSLAGRSTIPITAGDQDPIRQVLLGQLQLISLVGLGAVAIVGAIGAYWLAGRALQPLGEISHAAKRIDAQTLSSVDSLGGHLTAESREDEIAELASSLDEMLDRLEYAFTQQSHFVSNAAHELRTPLSTLRTNLEIVYSNPGSTLEDYRQISPVLDRTLTRLEELVSDLLIMATGEKSLVFEELDLKSLLEVVLAEIKPLADKHEVRLRLSGDAHTGSIIVRGDVPLLARLFGNLIENGILYNHKDGEVVVDVSRNDSHAVVTVGDTGIGIPTEEQTHIFDRFYRVDRSRSRHKGGAGLGLSIVSHIVRLHGGQVQLESTPGMGSKFTIQLPV